MPRVLFALMSASVDATTERGDRGPVTVVVVGNPKPASRTRAAAEMVVERLTGTTAVAWRPGGV
jgi:hypothetical protein